MSLKRASWIDPDGREKVVLLPENAEEGTAEMGIPVGPPSLEELGLPLDIEVRLNNELVSRGILTASEALKNRQEILLALQSVFKVDVNRVIQMYVGKDFQNAKSAREPVIQQSAVSLPRPRRR